MQHEGNDMCIPAAHQGGASTQKLAQQADYIAA